MNITETHLGYEIQHGPFRVLFGGVEAQHANLEKAYPQVQFARIKQIHSDKVVTTDAVLPQSDWQIADAHISKKANLGLCISTADCVPLMIYDHKTKWMGSIHAGWRGVATKIISNTIAALVNEGCKPQDLEVFVGPHIQKNSFEVGNDVRDQILSSINFAASDEESLFHQKLSAEKSLVDIHQVVKEQLIQNQIPNDQVHALFIDTFTDKRFHSHRRDKEKAGRQLSACFFLTTDLR